MEIQYLIVTALKNISFSNKRSYYFINSNEGDAVLYNTQSKLGKNINLWNLKDKSGNYLIRNQARLALTHGGGFLRNYFMKPDSNGNQEYPKLSYVKMFEPYNWHIGTGEYLDDIREDIKNEVLEYIASIRYGKNGYLFANTSDGYALVNDGKKLQTPRYWFDNPVFQKELKASKNKDGDFFFYKFKKLEDDTLFPKMAFVKHYEKWDWILGTGVYIDEVEIELLRKKELLKENIICQIIIIGLILSIFAVLIYVVAKKIVDYLDDNMSYLTDSFSKASQSNVEVETDKLTFEEFKVLANSLNDTLKSRNDVEENLKDYIKIVNENVIISSTDTLGVITSVSKAFCKVSGYSKDELIGRSHNIVRHIDTSKKFFAEMWSKLKVGKSWTGECKNRTKYDKEYWLSAFIHPNYIDNHLVGYTCIAEDITDKKRVELLSITDGLTSLYNRRYFNEKIIEEISRSKREEKHLCFMMIDVDYFKNYNDMYGHQEGDKVLIKISDELKHYTQRASDFAFRLGGEEFGLLCSNFNKEEAFDFANKIRHAIESLKIEHEGSSSHVYITVSIGLVVKTGSEIINDDIFYKEADEALYEAKEMGRNKVMLKK
jgi:diguanylate cyclase (GGDEF)-like protein/PAS domain S-box-containing protein